MKVASGYKVNGVVSMVDGSISEDEFTSKFINVLEKNGFLFTGTTEPEEESVTGDVSTFWDLYTYIQKAERDYTGKHRPEGFGNRWSFHIYSNKHQVNVCKDDVSVANFVFNENGDGPMDVSIVKVDNGYADYDNLLHVDINTVISDNGRWVSHLGKEGRFVRSIILDLLR